MSQMARPQRVGIVDDHLRYRQVLRAVVDAMPEVNVAWEVRNGQEALAVLATDLVDVLVVDLSLPGLSGVEVVRRAQMTWPSIAALVVSGHTGQSEIDESFAAGAKAYVLKGNPGELRDGIRATLAGDRYTSPRLAWTPRDP